MFWSSLPHTYVDRHRALASIVAALLILTVSTLVHGETADVLQGGSTMTIFGPQQYTRSADIPQTFSAHFEGCVSGACRLVVENGSPDRRHRVSSAWIQLNGTQIVGPRDLDSNVGPIIRSVGLAADNLLEIRLASRPSSYLTISVECDAGEPVIAVGRASASPQDNSLFIALPIENVSENALENVQITALELASGVLVTPDLPFALGAIAPEGTEVLQATFSGGPFLPQTTPALTVRGTYMQSGTTDCFTSSTEVDIPAANDGSGTASSGTLAAHHVTGAPFPAQPRDPSDHEENEGSRWHVPQVPFVPGATTPDPVQVQPPPNKTRIALPPQVIMPANHALNIDSLWGNAEPSGARGDGVLFVTANPVAAYSTDDGASFTELDPTTIFPADAVGFCCDQVVQYVPSIDRFVWLLQGTGYRLAVASPAQLISSGGTAWTYWTFDAPFFGQPAGTGLDYPDLAVTTNHLALSFDVGPSGACPMGCRWGLLVARINLGDIQGGNGIFVQWTNPEDAQIAWGSHLVQDSGDEIFWAGHRDNSHLRVFSWLDTSSTYFWRTISIGSWPLKTLTSTTPDGVDWLGFMSGFPNNAVLGGTRAGNRLWFAWTAGTDSRFPQPHIQMVSLDRDQNYQLLGQGQLWHPNVAFAYPALATNICTFDVGLSLEYGGGGSYESHAVGFWGDGVLYSTANSNLGWSRFGDYVTIRQQGLAHPNLFDAFGYGLRSSTAGRYSDVRAVTFGRPETSCFPGAAGTTPLDAPASESLQEPDLNLDGKIQIVDGPGGGMRISFSQKSAAHVRCSVYDVTGRLVKELESVRPAGRSAVHWDGSTIQGRRAPSGIYVVRVVIDGVSYSAKGVLIH